MVSFIDAHRAEHGVEPICKVLPIAPSTYYDHLAKRQNLPDGRRVPSGTRLFAPRSTACSTRTGRSTVSARSGGSSGREGITVARCTVARLMKDMGLQGIIRGKPHRTTVPDKKAPCPLDKVNRQFRVSAPNRLCPLGDCFNHLPGNRSATLLTWPLGKGSLTSPSSLMLTPDGLWAGG